MPANPHFEPPFARIDRASGGGRRSPWTPSRVDRHRPGRLRLVMAGLVLALLAAGCSGSGDTSPGDSADGPSGTGGEDAIAVQVASYELVTGREQRFIVGLVGNRDPGLVSFGTVDLQFDYLGTREQPVQPAGTGPRATGTFRPVPGQRIDASAAGPRLVEPSEGVGVYGADGVRFDRPGFWQVTVSARLGSATERASAPFHVLAEPLLPFPGDPAPRTANPVAGAPGLRYSMPDRNRWSSSSVRDSG